MKNNSVYGFIYVTTNHINGKKYIGQRKYDHNGSWKRYLGSGICLNNAIKVYGRKNFTKEIVAEANNSDELNDLEIYYIKLYNAVESDEYYNIADGGNCANNFAGKSEEEMDKIRKKISESRIGKFCGKDNPNYGNTGIKNSMFGIPKSEKHKHNISNANKNRPKSEETKRKMSENHANFSGKNNPSAKNVICLNTGNVFNTIKEASEFYGANYSGISQCCNKKRNYAGKHPETGEPLIWMYYEDWLKQKNQVIRGIE